MHPPFSVGLMMKTPMSCLVAASTAHQLVRFMKYQWRFT